MNRKTNANSIGERRGTVGGSRGSRPNHRQDSENEEMDESGLSDEDDEQVNVKIGTPGKCLNRDPG